jgi:hypothetical protein
MGSKRFGLENRDYGLSDMPPDHATSLYPQKLALTLPTRSGRSVGIVRSRTKVTELLVIIELNLTHLQYNFQLEVKYKKR